jgi:hypothetical protein
VILALLESWSIILLMTNRLGHFDCFNYKWPNPRIRIRISPKPSFLFDLAAHTLTMVWSP